MKFITIISSLYDRVYLCKPLTSRPSNSEKYIGATVLDTKVGIYDNVLHQVIKKTFSKYDTQIFGSVC